LSLVMSKKHVGNCNKKATVVQHTN
jgi:hypothetical protein